MSASPSSEQSSRKTGFLWLAAGILGAAGLGVLIASINRQPVNPDPHAHDPKLVEANNAATGPPYFRDMTEASRLHFTYRNGEEVNHLTILEMMGGGIALFDFDNDGLLDVFATGGGYFAGPENKEIKGHACKLFRNLGNWKFTDVSQAAGLDQPWFYNHGAAAADFDRDGWPDVLVTGYGRMMLLRNQDDGKSGRRFVDVTEKMGLNDKRPLHWSTSAGWADLDGDGFADLYVCHYVDWSFANHPPCKDGAGVGPDVCGPLKFKPLVHALFRNEGGKAFRDVSAAHAFKAVGNGLGVLLVDVNDDRRPDIYVANDATNNLLYMNRSTHKGGMLEERAASAGVAVNDMGHPTASMGVDAGDYDGSGRPSLWVTTFQGELHSLFRNLGNEQFHYQSRATGVNAIGMHLVGFGTSFFDIDNDGWEDLIIVNGHVLQRPAHGSTFRQHPKLLRNVEMQGRRFFKNVSAQGGSYFQTAAVSRGLAIGDLDNDGWADVVVSHNNTPVALLRNIAGEAAPANWLGVRIVGRGNRDVVGSTITFEDEKTRLTRFAKGGGSYLSTSDRRILFGLGSAKAAGRVTVKWSWGESQSWDDLQPGAYWELHEGVAAPRRVKFP